MKYIKRFNESTMVYNHYDVRKLLPKEISIKTSNGEYNLKLSDVLSNIPKLQVSYYHSTMNKTGDSLSDGEPDYMGFDFNFTKRGDKFEVYVEISYGDAMAYEFKITSPNDVKVVHYTGFGSKLDPKSRFALSDRSIMDLISFLNKFNFGLKLTRDKFNFLDWDKDSYRPK